MKRRDFLKGTLLTGVATALPAQITAKQEYDGLLRVTGKNGDAVVDFNNQLITINGLIEGQKLRQEIEEHIDIIAPVAPIPLMKLSSTHFAIHEDWRVNEPRQIIDCHIESELDIEIVGSYETVAEIYINRNAIHSDYSADILYRDSWANNLHIRPLVQSPPGSSLDIIAVNEEHASHFEVEIPQNSRVTVVVIV